MTNPHREPSADMRAAAAQLRQMYNALVAEGFTVAEALAIIGQILGNQQPPKAP